MGQQSFVQPLLSRVYLDHHIPLAPWRDHDPWTLNQQYSVCWYTSAAGFHRSSLFMQVEHLCMVWFFIPLYFDEICVQRAWHFFPDRINNGIVCNKWTNNTWKPAHALQLDRRLGSGKWTDLVKYGDAYWAVLHVTELYFESKKKQKEPTIVCAEMFLCGTLCTVSLQISVVLCLVFAGTQFKKCKDSGWHLRTQHTRCILFAILLLWHVKINDTKWPYRQPNKVIA